MKIFYLVLLTILLFISACSIGSPKLAKCKVIDDVDFQSQCYSQVAIETFDASICNKINNSDYVDYCYKSLQMACQIAIFRIDNGADVCNQIDDKEFKNRCISKITEADANKCRIEFPQICDKLSKIEDKEFCYNGLATISNNIKLCETITDSFINGYCYTDIARLRNDSKICEKIGETGVKDTCFSVMAKQKNDLNLCEKINEPYDKNMCSEEYYTRKDDTYAKNDEAQMNSKDCSFIMHEGIKSQCYTKIAELTHNCQECVKINGTENQQGCYVHLGELKYDLSKCGLPDLSKTGNCYFLNDSEKADCITRKALDKRDNELCSELQSQEIDECYLTYALNTKNIADCNPIQNQYQKDYCNYLSIVKTRNPASCDKILTMEFRNKCTNYTRLYYYTITHKYCSNTIGTTIQEVREVFHSDIIVNINWTDGLSLEGDKQLNIETCPSPNETIIFNYCAESCNNYCKENKFELVNMGLVVTLPERFNTNIKCHCLCK